MRKSLTLLYVGLTLLLLVSRAQSGELFFTYYNTWCMGYDSQWSLNQPFFISTKTYASQIGNTTHVIVFMGHEIVDQSYPPYLTITKDYADAGGGSADSLDFLWSASGNPGAGYSDWVARGGIEALRDSLHAKGKFILVDLQAVNASVGLNYVLTDSARTEVFSKAVARYCNTHNFDGADLNVENSQTYTNDQLVRFFRILRRNMPRPKLITAVPPPSDFTNYAPAAQYIDYILPQFYNWPFTVAWNSNVGANQIFLKAPLHKNPLPSGSELQDFTTYGPDNWYNAGWPKSKIVILMSNEANPASGSDQMFATAPGAYFWADTLAYWYLTHGGTYTWDDTHVGGYVHGTATGTQGMNGFTISSGQMFYIAVLSDRNLDSVVAWGRSKGYNNYGLYDVSTDARTPATVKTPRHAHLSSILNAAPSPPVPTGTFSSSPASLPTGGGTSTLSWTSSNATSASINQGIGTVTVNGSRTVTVTSTTTFSLTLTNANGSSTYSATVTVAAAPPPVPSAPVLATPANGATSVATSPTLNWNASTGATSYRVQVSTGSTFTTTVSDQNNITSTSCAPYLLAPNTKYYWRASATNTSGTSAYSAVWSFTTGASAGGPIAAYSFNEGTGTTVTDLTVNGITGTISGAGWTQGKYGNGLRFDGATSYVDLGIPALLQTTGSMTWSAWVNEAADPPDDGQIIAMSDDNTGWQLKSSPDTGPHTFGVAISSTAGSRTQRYSTTVRALNTWYFVAGVYNATAGTLDIYVNGVLDNGTLVGTVPSSQFAPALNANIGRRAAGFYFNGVIDELRIYNRALTQAEIQSDMVTPLGVQAPVPPQPPVLTTPANGASNQQITLNLGWNASNGASSYRVQVSTDSLFRSTLVNDSTVTSTSRQVGPLSTAAKYFWRVNAKNTAGTSAYCSAWSFTTSNAVLSAPTLVSPANGTSGVTTSPSLSWSSVTGATTYHLQVSTSATFGTTVVDQANLTTTSSALTALAAGTTYYWHVSASGTSGTSAYSSTFAFTTQTAATETDITLSGTTIAAIPNPTGSGGPITVIDDGVMPPTTSTDVTTQFDTFTGITNGTVDWVGYQFPVVHTFTRLLYQEGLDDNPWGGWFTSMKVQVLVNGTWTDAQNFVSTPPYPGHNLVNFEKYQLTFTPLTGTAIRLIGTPGGQNTYIGVGELRAFASDGVAAVPPVPALVAPPNSSTGQPTAVALSWNASNGATSYRLQVSSSATFTSTVVDQQNITATSYSPSGLAAGTTYYWRVSAANTAGTSAYAAAWNFTTASATPGLIAAYSFNEGAGTTVTDASGNGITGTIYGATWTQGKFGKALSFNGSTSYVDLGSPTALNVTGSMTWSAWVYATADPLDDGQFIARSDYSSGWQTKSTPDTGPQTFGVAVSGTSSSHTQRYSNTIRALNTWYHVAGVYNAAARTLDIYVNGVLDNGTLVGTIPASQYLPNVNVNIGRRTGGFYFAGIIDEVRLYNRALSKAEIQADMNTALGGTASPLLPPQLASVPKLLTEGEANPTLSWNPSPNATAYRVQISVDSLFSSVAFEDSAVTGNSREVGGLAPGTKYYWHVQAANESGTSPWSDNGVFTTASTPGDTGPKTLPEKFSLQQNYPNPFNPTTRITFALPVNSVVHLTVYNILGQSVATLVDQFMEAGVHSVQFDAGHLTSGVYFYSIEAGTFKDLKKMVLLR